MKTNTILVQIIINLIAIVVITLAIRHYLFYQNIDIDLELCKEVIRENLGDLRLQRITFIQIN